MQLDRVWPVVSAFVWVAVIACGGGSTPPTETASAPPAAAPVDAATAGSVTGKVMLQGQAPKAEVIKMGADPYCTTEHGEMTTEYYVVSADNGLDNVFVYVKSGLGDRKFPVPTTPVVLDQKGCRYYPHVLGVMVGQPLDIVNDDGTLHNVHAIPAINAEFNIGQPIQGMKTTHTFTAPEIMIPFKCDVHGWMNSYVGVVDNPYYAVSASGGTFELKNLPPGTYEIDAWHEKLGTQTQTVTVGERESKAVTFTFTLGG